MKAIKQLINFILFGNLYVALGAFSLCVSSSIELSIHPILNYAILCFFATLFIYNTQRIVYTKQNHNIAHSIRRSWIEQNRQVVFLLLIVSIAGLITLLFFNPTTIFLYLIPLFFFSLAYFFPSIELRKNAFLKQFILVFVWTATTAIVPTLMAKANTINQNDLFFFIARFCFMVAICLPFDIRDMNIDSSDKTATIPQLIGEKKTKLLAIGFAIIYLALEYTLFINNFIDIPILLTHLLTTLIIIVLIAIKSKSEYVYIFGLDGTMLLNGLLIFLCN